MVNILKKQREFFNQNETKTYAYKIAQLDLLYDTIAKNETNILKALAKDLGKSEFEAYATEVGFCLKSIRFTQKHLKKWLRTKKVKTPYYQFGSKSFYHYEPLGTVLIIGPYNYPFQLVIEPLIGALAAGNTVIIKPSEFTKATETLLKTMLNDAFDSRVLHVVTGGKDVASELLKHRFDHIFFTGSTAVGKIVYQEAAKNLTPVTLELGGKSPAIIDATANLKVTARRIAFGKFINAGQTCIAPDYVYIDQAVKAEFLDHLKAEIDAFYPNFTDDYSRIVNLKHYDRLMGLVDDKKVIKAFEHNRNSLLITPVIMDDVSYDDAVMQEEIFGPILPILTYQTIEDVITTLKTKEKPLALYLFTKNKQLKKKVFKELSFGSGSINDTIQQVVNPYLPFGGVGNSGFGSYHGEASFKRFSHQKTYTKRSFLIDSSVAYPPYKGKLKWIKKILR